MQDVFKTIVQTRANIMNLVDGLSLEQKMRVVPPHRNSLLWNMGHLLVSCAGLSFGRCGVPLGFESGFIERYAKGSTPNMDYAKDDWEIIASKWKSSIDVLQAAWANGELANYKSYTTSYGVELTNIEEAIRFISVHEGVHFGVMLSLKKFVE